jgi:hypothetical protein
VSHTDVQVAVEADDRITVEPPRLAEGMYGEIVSVPWYVRIGYGARLTFADPAKLVEFRLTFADPAKLVEFRDAITAALDERGAS